MFEWGDLWSGINALGGLANTGYGIYKNLFGGGGGGNYSPPQPTQPSMTPEDYMNMMAAFQPEAPDMTEWLAGMQDMLSGQQKMMSDQFSKQQALFTEQQQKGMARDAASTRKRLQSQGVYGSEGNIGAAGAESIATMLGVPPDELMTALKSFGNDYGFEV